MTPPIYPYGHFYSPIVDTVDIASNVEYIWRDRSTLAGIDLNVGMHDQILTKWFPRFIGDYDYPDVGDPVQPQGYFNLNDQFSWLDARALFV